MSEHDSDARDLAARQAEGLRALARMIEHNPELAERMQFPLSTLEAFVLRRDEAPRTRLQDFRRAALAAGADVTVDNGPDRCVVSAAFGAVRLCLSAGAEQMAGLAPKPMLAYEPLEGIDPTTEEC